jgi:hypothetical protein
MNETELGGLEYGVVLWIVVFLALWWTVGLFLWRRYWPRIVRSRRRREHRRSQRRGEDDRGSVEHSRTESIAVKQAGEAHV